MNVETLQTFSRMFYIVAGALFLISVVMFIAFDIPKLIADITGISERKGIAEIRQRTEHSNTGSITGAISASRQLTEQASSSKQLIEQVASSPSTTRLTTVKLSGSRISDVSGQSVLNKQTLNEQNEKTLPVINPDAVFTVIQEFSFTSSTEIIE